MKAARVMLRRLSAAPFASIIALIGVNSAVTLFIQPNRVPTHALLAPYDYLWAALYGLGGLSMLVGIAGRWANLETAGCIAFAGGSLISAVTWAAVGRAAAWNTVLLLVLFTVAALIRARYVAQGRIVVLVEPVDGKPGSVQVVDDGIR